MSSSLSSAAGPSSHSHIRCHAEDGFHDGDLDNLFRDVILVDAYSIYPEQIWARGGGSLNKEFQEVLPNFEGKAIDFCEFSGCVHRSLGV
jgi:hypothetical protein